MRRKFIGLFILGIIFHIALVYYIHLAIAMSMGTWQNSNMNMEEIGAAAQRLSHSESEHGEMVENA